MHTKQNRIKVKGKLNNNNNNNHNNTSENWQINNNKHHNTSENWQINNKQTTTTHQRTVRYGKINNNKHHNTSENWQIWGAKYEYQFKKSLSQQSLMMTPSSCMNKMDVQQPHSCPFQRARESLFQII